MNEIKIIKKETVNGKEYHVEWKDGSKCWYTTLRECMNAVMDDLDKN